MAEGGGARWGGRRIDMCLPAAAHGLGCARGLLAGVRVPALGSCAAQWLPHRALVLPVDNPEIQGRLQWALAASLRRAASARRRQLGRADRSPPAADNGAATAEQVGRVQLVPQ